jgi:hypothetical protein
MGPAAERPGAIILHASVDILGSREGHQPNGHHQNPVEIGLVFGLFRGDRSSASRDAHGADVSLVGGVATTEGRPLSGNGPALWSSREQRVIPTHSDELLRVDRRPLHSAETYVECLNRRAEGLVFPGPDAHITANQPAPCRCALAPAASRPDDALAALTGARWPTRSWVARRAARCSRRAIVRARAG